VSADREPTRLMRLGDRAEARATDGHGTYPRPEDDLSRLDRWDRDRTSAPRPIRDLERSVRRLRVALLVVCALGLLALVVATGALR
jgi:hypothetical protein